MATAAAPPPPASLWATFALTETRWLIHALGWALVLWLALVYVPWLFYGGGALRWLGFGHIVVVELALLAAIATGYSTRDAPALPAGTVVRYALVDATFVAFTTPWIIVPLHAALAAAGLTPLVGGHGPPPMIPIAVFVCFFYAGLGVVGHVRARAAAPRGLPLAATLTVVALLVVQSYGAAIDHFGREAERNAGVAQYERSTGKVVEGTDQLAIGNSLHGFEHRVGMIEQDARGRLLVSGGFSYYAGHDARALVRLMPDGRLDASFAKMPPGDPMMITPSNLRIADDGAILIVHPQSGLSRLREDGTPDAEFRPDVRTDAIEKQPLQVIDTGPDGSVVLVSPTRWASTPEDRCILRLDRSGARDRAFEAAAMQALFATSLSQAQPVACNINSITVLASGHVLVNGAFPSTRNMQGFVRLNADGTLDTSYQAAAGVSGGSMMHVSRNGEVFTIDYVPVPGSKPAAYKPKWAKLLPTGEIDPAFAVPDGTLDRIEALAAQADGKLIVAGSRGFMGYGTLVRLTAQGRLDPDFGGAAGAPRVDGFVISIRVQADGRIVLGGEFREFRHGSTKVARHNIVRVLADGSLDTQFEPRRSRA
jgi:uncharacterized delta-60 repeat protein